MLGRALAWGHAGNYRSVGFSTPPITAKGANVVVVTSKQLRAHHVIDARQRLESRAL